MRPETPFEDIVPLAPDSVSRHLELTHLQSLTGVARLHEPGAGGPFQVRKGNALLLSAPHEMTHVRDGLKKQAETGTAAFAFALATYSGGSALATAEEQRGDPSWDLDNPYVDRASDLAKTGAVIDIHIMRPRGVEMCLGLGPRPELAQGLWNVLLEEAVAGGLRASINWPFAATSRTVTSQLQRRGVRAIQVELSSDCFDRAHVAMERAWTAMARAARRLAA
jgi:hypothetical protein